MKTHAEQSRISTLGIALAILRGALTAIFWIQPLASPHAVVRDMVEAKQCAREWFDAKGMYDIEL